jgi:hypothetical protein
VPDSDQITIADLLKMRSGLYDYTEAPDFSASLDGDPTKVWTPDEVLVPILEKGEEPFAIFNDLWIKHREWVFDPIRYPSVDRLIEVLDTEIVRPAQARFADLLARKPEKLRVEDI